MNTKKEARCTSHEATSLFHLLLAPLVVFVSIPRVTMLCMVTRGMLKLEAKNVKQIPSCVRKAHKRGSFKFRDRAHTECQECAE